MMDGLLEIKTFGGTALTIKTIVPDARGLKGESDSGAVQRTVERLKNRMKNARKVLEVQQALMKYVDEVDERQIENKRCHVRVRRAGKTEKAFKITVDVMFGFDCVMVGFEQKGKLSFHVPASLLVDFDRGSWIPLWLAEKKLKEMEQRDHRRAVKRIDAEIRWLEKDNFFNFHLLQIDAEKMEADFDARKSLDEELERKRAAEKTAMQEKERLENIEKSAQEKKRKEDELKAATKKRARIDGLEGMGNVDVSYVSWSSKNGNFMKSETTVRNVALKFSGDRVYIIKDGEEIIKKKSSVTILTPSQSLPTCP